MVAASPGTRDQDCEYLRNWSRQYRFLLDGHTDSEIGWEQDFWASVGVEALAVTCADILAERREAQTELPGGADSHDLALLLSRVPSAPVLRLVEHEALPLVEAMRLVFWAGLSEDAR